MTSSLPGKPLTWIPRGVCDALDGTMAFQGAMSNLQNLIPDPTTRGLWQSRPAATSRVDVGTDIAGATFISCLLNVGTRIYGMAGPVGGKDYPFCYDLQTQAFIPITGPLPPNSPPNATDFLPIQVGHLPFSPQNSGNWSPPTMALVGGEIIISHPGFVSSNGYFGVITITKPFQLTYTSTNTAPVPLIFPPTWVENFNGRCYFLVNPPTLQPAAYFSDSLNPTSITNANQILTFGDNQPLTCAAGLQLSNQLGGIIQALMVFKEVSNIFQVTGDYAFGNLAINSLNVATGTFAPNSVVSSEKGLLFMAPDGIRLIDFAATVSDPIGKDGQGITVPFIQAVVPSRSCAAFNTGIYRVQVQNVNTQQEYWFDTVRDLWSGPHTTGQSLIIPYQDTFICTLQSGAAHLFQSDPIQGNASTFIEQGNAMSWIWRTVNLPDTDDLCTNCCIEATLSMQLPPLAPAQGAIAVKSPWSSGFSSGFGPLPLPTTLGLIQIMFVDQNLVVIDQVEVSSSSAGTLWGQFNWGQALWGGALANLFPQQLAWHVPIVFRRGSVLAAGLSSSQLRIGQLRMRIQELGYLQPYPYVPGLFVLGQSPLGGGDALG